MAKSISLSFDMNTLYLITDDGKAEPFSLSGDGVNISLDSSGLKAVASTDPNPGADGVMRSKINNQWSFEYSNEVNQLHFIGIQDIIGGRTPEVHSFDLDNETINVRLLGDSILITTY